MSEVWVVGGLQRSVTVPSPRSTSSIGPTMPGLASGVAGAEESLQSDSPTALTARTWNR